MRSRPDGRPAALSRLLQRSSRTLKVYGTLPLGEGYAVGVSLRKGEDGLFTAVRITLAGHPTRRGIALLPDEVASVAAFLQRAASDLFPSAAPHSSGGQTLDSMSEAPDANSKR